MVTDLLHCLLWILILIHCTWAAVPSIQYSHNMRIVRLPNSTLPNSLIYRLKAAPSAEIQHQFGITSGTDMQMIRIEPVDFYQANVYLNKRLEAPEYNFTLYVSDGREKTEFQCQIQVINTTDVVQSPFIHYQPLMSISENAGFNATVGYVHVKERQSSNLPVTFEIKGSDNFGIRYIFGPKGTSKAEIFLRNKVDYEQQNMYRLRIFALNAQTNETIDTRNIIARELIITIVNEQDTPPQFYQLPNLIEMSEASKPGDVLMRLYAIDGDYQQDRIIQYELRQDNELRNFFAVGSDNGQFAAYELDQEDDRSRRRPVDTNHAGRLIHSAHDARTEAVRPLSAWTDEDDLDVELLDPGYGRQANQANNQFTNQPANQPINRSVRLAELSFDEESDAGESMYSNRTSILSEREIESESIGHAPNDRLSKSDRSNVESEVSVAFVIIQSSNSAPAFVAPGAPVADLPDNDLWKGQISELAPVGSKVQFDFELQVQDRDFGINGTLDLRLEDATNAFQVHPQVVYRNQTVDIVLKNPSKIKFETLANPNITVKIIATDRSPVQSLGVELNVIVQVLDQNDHVPAFAQREYQVSFGERSALPLPLIQLHATDQDSGHFGQITYASLSGLLAQNLELNRDNGMLTLVSLANVDREQRDSYDLIVEACDNHCRPGASNRNHTLIHVHILDANDHKPEFVQPRYDFLFKPDLSGFSSPVQVRATDLDQPDTPNSNVTYEIVAGNLQQQFDLDPMSGLIKLRNPIKLPAPTFDLEQMLDEGRTRAAQRLRALVSPIVNLTIRAHDHGIPILDSYINVYFHHQNFVNRTVAFLINQPEHIARKQKLALERQLSELTGAVVAIESIREPLPTSGLHSNSSGYVSLANANQLIQNQSWVLASVAYPLQSALSIQKMHQLTDQMSSTSGDHLASGSMVPDLDESATNGSPNTHSRTGRKNHSNQNGDIQSIRIISGYHEHNFIFWLLLVIILITLIFLLILIGIWCYFCGCYSQKRNKVGSADSLIRSKSRQSQHHSSSSSSSTSSSTAQMLKMNPNARHLNVSPTIGTAHGIHGMHRSTGGSRNQQRCSPTSGGSINSINSAPGHPTSSSHVNYRTHVSNVPNAHPPATGALTAREEQLNARMAQANRPDYAMTEFDAVAFQREMRRARLVHQQSISNVADRPMGANHHGNANKPEVPGNESRRDPSLYATAKRNRVKFSDGSESSGRRTGELMIIRDGRSDEDEQDEQDDEDEFDEEDPGDAHIAAPKLSEKHRSLSQLTLFSQFEQPDGEPTASVPYASGSVSTSGWNESNTNRVVTATNNAFTSTHTTTLSSSTVDVSNTVVPIPVNVPLKMIVPQSLSSTSTSTSTHVSESASKSVPTTVSVVSMIHSPSAHSQSVPMTTPIPPPPPPPPLPPPPLPLSQSVVPAVALSSLPASSSANVSNALNGTLKPNSILKNAHEIRNTVTISPTSDSDSGIGHQHPNTGGTSNHLPTNGPSTGTRSTPVPAVQLVPDRLLLKNQHVASRQSVFTIAYNDVRPNRLNSADSARIAYI